MTIIHHPDLVQGSDEWLAARCGLLTASEMKLIITPTLKAAFNDKERAHLYEIMAQRITRFVEPAYVSDDMLRGQEDEIDARILYAERFAPVEDVGFITNDRWGFTLGYSPDGLVGKDGLIECKSRRQKFQVETLASQAVPPEFMIQLQTGLLVSERVWVDFVSYSGGLPMLVLRVFADDAMQGAIIAAAAAFEDRLQTKIDEYWQVVKSSGHRLVPTERRIVQEMYLS